MQEHGEDGNSTEKVKDKEVWMFLLWGDSATHSTTTPKTNQQMKKTTKKPQNV